MSSPRTILLCGLMTAFSTLLLSAGAGADVTEPPGKAANEITARQTGERVDLELEQARRSGQLRRHGPDIEPDQARRVEQQQTVERLRQQSRHEEERTRLGRRRPGDPDWNRR